MALKAEPTADDTNSGVIDDNEMATKIIDFGANAPNQIASTTKPIATTPKRRSKKPELLGPATGRKANKAEVEGA